MQYEGDHKQLAAFSSYVVGTSHKSHLDRAAVVD